MHSKLHANSFEGEMDSVRHADHLAQFDRTKVATVEGILVASNEENFIGPECMTALPTW